MKISKNRLFIRNSILDKNYSLIESLKIFKNFDIFKFNSSLNLILKFSIFLKNNFIYGKFYLPYNVFKLKNFIFFSNFFDFNICLDLNFNNFGLDNIIYNILFSKFIFKFIIINFNFFYYLNIFYKIIFKINVYNLKNNFIKNNFLNLFYNIKYGFNFFKTDDKKFLNFFLGKIFFKNKFLILNILEFLKFINLKKPFFIKNKFFNKFILYSTMGFKLNISDKKIFNYFG